MSNELEKVKAIIHSASIAAGTVGAGLAQLPCSDNAAITPIQIAMIVAIGEVYGQDISLTAAASTLSTASAGIVGRALSQAFIGWVPAFGNVLNASTAFTVTQAIGWSANTILSKAE